MKKRVFSSELAYVVGLTILALGVAMTERADLGVSMVVAPAYILHLKLSESMPFFTFGMAEYCLQAVLLVLMVAVLRRAKLSYLFSFVTAVLYGFLLDFFIWVVGFLPAPELVGRIALYAAGMLFSSVGVALLFRTYIAPEVYELFVKEVSARYGIEITLFKTVYDLTSCLVSVMLSFLFFGLWHFEGVKWGTVVAAFCNGPTIRVITKWLTKRFTFRDSLPLRKYF